MTAAVAAVTAIAGESPVRHALRRLWVYIRHNAGYYLLCAFITVGYALAFVAVPPLVGRAIETDEWTPRRGKTYRPISFG